MSITIGELAIEGALTFSDGYRTKRSEHGQPGFRILRVADVADGCVSPTGDDFVAQAWETQIGTKLSQPGDVLLTTKGTVGRVAIMPLLDEPVVYSPQLCYFRVHDAERLDARWLSYWFKSDDFLHQASHRANNSDMAAYINLADIRSLQLPEVVIEDQRGIAEVLGALDDKIAANISLVTTANGLAAHLTRAAMTGGTQALMKIAMITMGSSPPGTSYNESGEGVVFYQGVRDFGVRFPRNRVWTTEPGRQAQADDTLVSVRAPVGRTNLAREQTCIGRGLASIRSVSGRPFSLFHILRDSPDSWAPYEAEGTVFGSINKQQLSEFHVSVVDEIQSDRLECDLKAIEARIAAAIHESADLTEVRDALLPQLMSGKIKVKDAERVVEGVV